MTRALPHSLLFLTCLLAQATPAQQGSTPPALGDPRVPLHTMPDDPDRGTYGLWTAGADYKASFHDGFAFYPRRGPDDALVSLRWQTESVQAGGVELLTRPPTARTTDWRHELRYGSVAEVYDVLPEGVEQSFVLHETVRGGDVVVRGKIGGQLRAPVVRDAHQALSFSDGTSEAVRYGEAIAFDTAGRRTTVTTSYDGEHVRLTLGAGFLQTAVFPVTIDPLTSAVGFGGTLNTAPTTQPSLAADNSTPGGKVLVVYTRRFATGDEDAYGVLCDKDFGNAVTVFSDVTTSFSTDRVDTAHVDGGDRFVVALQAVRAFTGTRHIRIYTHGQANTALNGGTMLYPRPPAGMRWQNPRVGGARGSGKRALIVFEQESSASSGGSFSTTVRGLTVDVQTGWLSSAADLDVSGAQSRDSEEPVVVPSSLDQADWIACWRVRNLVARTYAIHSARITPTGVAYQSDIVLLTSDPLSSLALAGSWGFSPPGGRYVVAWVRDTSNGQLLEAERFDQPVIGTPTTGPVRILSSTGSGSFADVRLAHDWQTRSHWALTYSSTSLLLGKSCRIVRLGHTAAITESDTVAGSSLYPSGASVAYAEPGGTGHFLTTYGEAQAFFPRVVGREFRYSSAAITTRYGPICHPAASISANRPFAGHEFFRVDTAPVAWLEPIVFFIGVAPTSIPLGGFGFVNSCSLVVDPTTAVSVGFANPSPAGSASIVLPLPDAPLFIGDLFVQAAVLPTNGATPWTSRGLGVQVR